jgi:hypothetical protein
MRAIVERVLETDLRLHGRRFVLVEFIGAAVLCCALAVVVATAAIVRGSVQLLPIAGIVFFLGVATNSLAVSWWIARREAVSSDRRRASANDAVVFALATLVPGALVFALTRSKSE